MPLLDHTRLANHKEWRLAELVLSLMAQGYVWVFGEEGVPAVSFEIVMKHFIAGLSDIYL